MAVQKFNNFRAASEQGQRNMMDACYYLGRATALLEDLDEVIAHG